MKLMVWVFFAVGIGIPLAYAEPFEVLELGLTINGVILPLELPPSRESATARREGANYACKRPQHATEHHANMLQARCVTANVRTGMDQSDILLVATAMLYQHLSQLRQGPDLHFLLDVSPVALHGPFADIQLRCDHLVGLPFHQALQDLSLARRECLHLLVDRGPSSRFCSQLGVPLQRVVNTIEKILIGAGFFDKIDSPCLHGSYSDGHIAMPGQHDYG
jgi:hypothetical protein